MGRGGRAIITPEQIAEMRQLRSEGHSYTIIARRVGVAVSTAATYTRYLKVQTLRKEVITDNSLVERPKPPPIKISELELGCKWCGHTITVPLPIKRTWDDLYEWRKRTSLTCGSCNTSYRLYSFFENDEMKLFEHVQDEETTDNHLERFSSELECPT